EPTLFLPLLTAVGDTAQERHRDREAARLTVAYSGSTPNYHFIFDQLGRPDVGERLRTARRAGDFAGLVEIIDDELLGQFVVEATWAQLADRIADRAAPLAGYDVQIVLYNAAGDDFQRLGAATQSLHKEQ